MQPENLADHDDVKALKQSFSNVLMYSDQADVKLPSAAAYTDAAEHLRLIQSLIKQTDETRKKLTAPLDEQKKSIMSFFKSTFVSPLETTRDKLKRALLAYDEEQRRKAREAQAAAEEKARKERERLEARAAKAAEDGKEEKAEELARQASGTVAPIVAPNVPKAKGISTRTVWGFEVEDIDKVPRTYLALDEQKVRKVVQALKDDTDIPGIKVTKSQSLAAAS